MAKSRYLLFQTLVVTDTQVQTISDASELPMATKFNNADLFISVEPLHQIQCTKVAPTMNPSRATSGLDTARSPAPGQGPIKSPLDPNVHASNHPLRRKRRFTIGGVSRCPATGHCSPTCGGNDPVKMREPYQSGSIDCKATELNMDTPATPSEGNMSHSRSRKPHCPPTSWKAASGAGDYTKPMTGGTSSFSVQRHQDDKGPAGSKDIPSRTVLTIPPSSLSGNMKPSGRERVETHGPTPVPVKTTGSPSAHDKESISTGWRRSREASLPDPEEAYANTFYYTACFHTSPPCSRPLNAQPVQVEYHENLLAYPPPQLQTYHSHPERPPPVISILTGSCSNCDHFARRRTEQEALDKYSHDVEILSIELGLLQQEIDPDYRKEPGSERNWEPESSSSGVSSSNISHRAIRKMLRIEGAFDELIKTRDREIKSIWKGYTARWGPATIKIHRDHAAGTNIKPRNPTFVEDDSVSEETSTSSENPKFDANHDTSSTNTSTSTGLTSHHTSSSIPASRRSSQLTRRSRATSTGALSGSGRYSDGTHKVVIQSCVDGVRENGKMVVDWIRPERSRSGRGI